MLLGEAAPFLGAAGGVRPRGGGCPSSEGEQRAPGAGGSWGKVCEHPGHRVQPLQDCWSQGGGGVLTPSLPCREIPPHCSLALGWSAPSWELGGDSHKGKAAGLMAPGTALEGLKLA